MSLSSPPLYPPSSQWECEACSQPVSSQSKLVSRASLTSPRWKLKAALSSSDGGFRAALASLLPRKEGSKREEKVRREEPTVLVQHHPSVVEERRRLYRSHTLSNPGDERKAGQEEGKMRLRREVASLVSTRRDGSRAEGPWKRGRERELLKLRRREEEEEMRRRGLVRGSDPLSGRMLDSQRSGKGSVRRVRGDNARGHERSRLSEAGENGERKWEVGEGMGAGGGKKGRERLRRAISLPSSKHRISRMEVRCGLRSVAQLDCLCRESYLEKYGVLVLEFRQFNGDTLGTTLVVTSFVGIHR